MILRLVREQLRSQWRYTAWSAGLLAFALALATYAMVTGATVIAENDADSQFAPREHTAVFDSVVSPGPEVPDHGLSDVTRLDLDQVEGLIATASAEVTVQAVLPTWATTEGYPEWLWVNAFATPIAWDRYLASGRAPRHGEVAVGDSVARTLAIGVGDPITLISTLTSGPTARMTFVVSGVLRPGRVAPYWASMPGDVVASWSDARAIAIALPSGRATNDLTGASTTLTQTQVWWNGDSGTLAPYESRDYVPSPSQGFRFGRALDSADQPSSLALAASCLALVGIIIASLAMGRSQAEARTQWAATTRVLGATRRALALSSLIETAFVSLVGIGLGLGLGIAAVAANIAVLRARHPEALLPSGPSVPAALLFAGVGIGTAIAIVAAAAPAFWTARVSPAAALKPVTPIGEAGASREVSAWWPAWILAGSGIAWAALYWMWDRGERSGTDAIVVLMWVSCLAVFVSAAALVLEGSRRLVGVMGGALAGSRRPTLVAAGDGLRAHRHVFTFASLSSFALTAVFAWNATDKAIRATDPYFRAWTGSPPLPSFHSWWHDYFQASDRAAGLGLLIGVATVVAVAVTQASRATFATDAATRTALGLGGTGERLAASARQWAVMGSAAVLGGLVGWAAHLLLRLLGAALSPHESAYSLHWNLTVAAYGLAGTALLIGVALGVTLAGSLAVGLLTRSGTAVEVLRRAAR